METSLSNVYSSTFSEGLDRIGGDGGLDREQVVAKVGIGLAEFLTSSTFLSYGVILSYSIANDACSLQEITWTAVLFWAAWHLTAPWSRFACEKAEDYQENFFKILITGATACLFVSILMPWHQLGFGVLGGTICNFISTQLRLVATEKFNTDAKVYEGNAQLGRALGLLLLPHLVLNLLDNYTVAQTQLIFASILLHTIPVTLIIFPPKGVRYTFTEMSRYNTLPALSRQMKEMMAFSNPSEIEAATDDEQDKQASIDDVPPSLTPQNLQCYYSNAGVSILPEIPEEEEEDNINSKRLSTRLAADSVREVFNINDLIAKTQTDDVKVIEYIPNYKPTGKFIKEFKMRVRCCQPYNIFLWKRRWRCLKDFAADNFLRPFWYSLKDPCFYPTVVSKGSLLFVSAVYVAVAPYLALVKNSDFRMEETSWVLSYIAFSWCLFLLLLPWVTSFSNGRLRVMYVGGLLLAACSMLILTKLRPRNHLTILSCLLFGLGFGIVSYTETAIHRWFIGARKWNMVRGTLDTTSALLVVVIYYLVVHHNVDILNTMPLIAFVVYSCNAMFWCVAPILVLSATYFKKYLKKVDDNFV